MLLHVLELGQIQQKQKIKYHIQLEISCRKFCSCCLGITVWLLRLLQSTRLSSQTRILRSCLLRVSFWRYCQRIGRIILQAGSINVYNWIYFVIAIALFPSAPFPLLLTLLNSKWISAILGATIPFFSSSIFLQLITNLDISSALLYITTAFGFFPSSIAPTSCKSTAFKACSKVIRQSQPFHPLFWILFVQSLCTLRLHGAYFERSLRKLRRERLYYWRYPSYYFWQDSRKVLGAGRSLDWECYFRVERQSLLWKDQRVRAGDTEEEGLESAEREGFELGGITGFGARIQGYFAFCLVYLEACGGGVGSTTAFPLSKDLDDPVLPADCISVTFPVTVSFFSFNSSIYFNISFVFLAEFILACSAIDGLFTTGGYFFQSGFCGFWGALGGMGFCFC